jgi:hypothetical protein
MSILDELRTILAEIFESPHSVTRGEEREFHARLPVIRQAVKRVLGELPDKAEVAELRTLLARLASGQVNKETLLELPVWDVWLEADHNGRADGIDKALLATESVSELSRAIEEFADSLERMGDLKSGVLTQQADRLRHSLLHLWNQRVGGYHGVDDDPKLLVHDPLSESLRKLLVVVAGIQQGKLNAADIASLRSNAAYLSGARKPLLRVDVESKTAWIGGERHDLTTNEQAEFLKAVIGGQGSPVTYPGRPDRLYKELPSQIKEVINGKPGAGYWVNRTKVDVDPLA